MTLSLTKVVKTAVVICTRLTVVVVMAMAMEA
jgi:hypothetical protein